MSDNILIAPLLSGCVYDKKIYVCGGHNDTEHSDKLLVLDGPAGKWRPLAPMLQARSYHAMAIAGSQIYVFGGCCQIGEDIKDLYVSLTFLALPYVSF